MEMVQLLQDLQLALLLFSVCHVVLVVADSLPDLQVRRLQHGGFKHAGCGRLLARPQGEEAAAWRV